MIEGTEAFDLSNNVGLVKLVLNVEHFPEIKGRVTCHDTIVFLDTCRWNAKAAQELTGQESFEVRLVL